MKENYKEISIGNNFEYRDLYQQPLFDPVQSHAVYGIETKEMLESVKKTLKEKGAKRFRTIKNRYGFYILCYKGLPNNN